MMKSAAEERTLPDLMSRGVETILPTTSILEAAKFACSKNFHQLIVAEEDRRFIGLLSVKQLLRVLRQSADAAAVNGPQVTPSSPVSEVLKPLAIALPIHTTLDDVHNLLMQFSVDMVPVVDRNHRVVGALDVLHVLRQCTTSAAGEPEPTFKFVTTRSNKSRRKFPAYFRRASGSLVLPVSSLETRHTKASFARLGYDECTERILVQLDERSLPGGASVRKENLGREGDYLVIPAADFLHQFKIDGHGRAYDVTFDSKGIILTPRK